MNVQKQIAARLLKTSHKKIRLDPSKAIEINEAITKKDIRGLIKEGAIFELKSNQHSRSGARRIASQKRKGRRKGPGSRKGTITARLDGKTRWVMKIRAIRKLLKELKEKKEISQELFKELYQKSKGGFFRSRRHINIYLEERGIKK